MEGGDKKSFVRRQPRRRSYEKEGGGEEEAGRGERALVGQSYLA